MHVVVLRGVPGSGKSSFICQYIEEHLEERNYEVVSADHYFEHPELGYQFDASKLGEAHRACLRRFISLCQNSNAATVFVDNTNLTLQEIAPYVRIAEAYGHEYEIVRIVCDPVVAANRNQHGVPFDKVLHMADKMKIRLPWKETYHVYYGQVVDVSSAPTMKAAIKIIRQYKKDRDRAVGSKQGK